MDKRYYRCNSPIALDSIWGDYSTGPRAIENGDPATAAWGHCDRDYPREAIVSPYPFKTAQEHYEALMAETKGVWINLAAPDLAGAIKGKRTLSSMQDAVDTVLAQAKIAAADQGAKVVLAARSAQTLDSIVESIRFHGGDAVAVVSVLHDLTKQAENERLKETIAQQLSSIETLNTNLASLEKSMVAVKIGGTLSDDKEKDAMRRQLDNVIVEIDKILTSLND